ncbi:MAG: hypothetical protein IKZ47_02160 [Clostridia bacterium]|nr:hypothetical protein [Clostridia bacterium]
MKFRRLTGAVLAVALCAVLSLTFVPASAQGVVIKGEPDGQNKSTVMDEHFYSGSLEPNFTSDSVTVATDSYGMHFTGAYHYGSALVLAAYKLKNYNRFTFSVDLLDSNDGFIYCGFGGDSPSTTVSKFDFNLCVSKGVTAIYEMGGMDSWTSMGSTPLSNALAVGKTTDFAVTLQRTGGNNFKITFELLEDGEPVFTTDYNSATVRMEHPNGHFCMWGGANEVFNLRDFKVYDSPDHVAFSDDFVNSSLTYGDEPVGDSSWHINEARFTSDEVYIARDAGPEFSKPGDTITAKTKLSACDTVSKPYEISFNAQIKSLEKNSTFGLYLGAENPGDISGATVIGVSDYNGKTASVDLIKNGEFYDYGDSHIPAEVLSIDDTSVDFEAVIYSDHTLTFTVGGIRFTFNNIKYDGYWGICCYSSDKISASQVRLTGVKVIKNTYAPCEEPDLSNSFGGIKMTQDGFEEYYISDRTYYLGPGVSLRPKGAFTAEPSLYFEGAGSYSSFGPKQPYTDFILQFDLKMVSEGKNGQWFGVAFGKKAFASIPDFNTCINFEYYAWGTAPYTQLTANLCTFEDGSKAKKAEGYHFYKDQDTKYNFMIVAKNRTVYVYYKEDSEDISKLGICRAVIPDVNTAGYVGIFGVSGISFDIFNYKITNIAPEATGDSAIALRENFEGEKLSDKLVKEGAAAIENGALKLSGGSIATASASRYYIANFTVLESGADITVSFSDNRSAVISGDLKTVTVKDGAKSTAFDISEYGLPDYKNVQMQLILQYDALSLAAKGIYEPGDKLALPMVEYTFSAPVAEGILKWTSDNAVIDDISVYALDNTYTAADVSYEQDPNDVNMWISKLAPASEQQAKSGPSVLIIVIYSVMGAVILALLAVIIVLSVKKRGKKQ